MHADGKKYMYDIDNRRFYLERKPEPIVPRRIERLVQDPAVKEAIRKACNILGVN